MVNCLTHGLRGFNGAVQRRLATLTVTMLISSCWQLSSEVELRRIFDVCKRWANSGSHEFVKKNMVRYMRLHGRFAQCSCKNAAGTCGRGRQAEVEGKCCIFILAVRQPPVLASSIEIYYFFKQFNKQIYQICYIKSSFVRISSSIRIENILEKFVYYKCILKTFLSRNSIKRFYSCWL